MNLRASGSPAGLQLSLQYSTDLYDAAQMEGVLAQLELVLRAVVERPGIRLRELREACERAAVERRTTRARAVEAGDLEKLRRIRRPKPAGGRRDQI